MTEHDPHRDPDRELQDYLRGSHRLSARYRAANRETTTPELDAAVLQHARSAVQKPAPVIAAKPSWQQRWAVPVGIAATLLIGVDLAWRVHDRSQVENLVRETVAVAAVQRQAQPAAGPQAGQFPPAPSAPAADAALVMQEAPAARSETRAQRVQPAPAPATDESSDFAADATLPEAVLAAPPPDAADRYLAESAPAEAEMQREKAHAAMAVAESARQKSDERAYAQASKRNAMAMAAAPPPAAAQVELMSEPEPVIPRRSLDEARAVAEDLMALLRAGTYDELKSRYQAQLTRQALNDAGAVFAKALTPRYAEDPDGTWRVDFLDADQRLRCTARLRPTEAGWQLVELVTRPG